MLINRATMHLTSFSGLITLTLFSAVLGQDTVPGDPDPTVSVTSGPIRSVYAEGTNTSTIFHAQCLIDGTYTSGAWWYKGIRQVVNQTQSSIQNAFKTLTLVLADPKGRPLAMSDDGWYECRAYVRSKDKVVTAKDRITIVVAAKPKIISVPPSPVIVTHGTPLSLLCQAVGYNISVTWIQPSSATQQLTNVLSSADGMSANGTLTIPSTVWNNDSGPYSCTISTSALCNSSGTFGSVSGSPPCMSLWTGLGPLSGTINVVVTVNPPGPCRQLRESRVTASTARLSWRLPLSQGSTPVNSFLLLCSSTRADSSVVQSVNQTIPLSSPQLSNYTMVHNVTGLWPYSTIICSVSASNPGGSLGPAATVQFTTPEGVPGVVRQVSTTYRNATTIRLTWMPPSIADQNGVLKLYKVGFATTCSRCRDCCEQMSCTTKGNRNITAAGPSSVAAITATGLCHFVSYQFYVQACNTAECGPSAVPFNAATGEVAPTPPAVTATTINTSAITVSWKTPSPSTFGPVRLYTVTPTAVCSCCCSLRTCDDKPQPITRKTTQLVQPDALFTHTFNGLCLGTTYSFTIIATNNAGSSQPSSPAQARTFDGVPGAPSQVMATSVSMSSIRVNWTMPITQHAGTLSHFTLTLSGSCDRHCCCGPEYACKQQDLVNVQITDLTLIKFTHLFAGLCPSTNYHLGITASNKLHTSAPSPAVLATTLPGVPSAVQSAECNITQIEPHVLATVSWQPPRIRNGVILYYTETIRQFTQTGENTTRLSITKPPMNSSSIDDLLEITLQNNFTAAEPNQPRTSLSADYLIKWHVYDMVVTAATAAGRGPSLSVNCRRGWNFTTIIEPPKSDDDNTTLIVVLVVIIVVLLILVGIAFVLRKEGKLPWLKTSKDDPDGAPLTEGDDLNRSAPREGAETNLQLQDL